MAMERSVRSCGKRALNLFSCAEINLKCSRAFFCTSKRSSSSHNSADEKTTKDTDSSEFRVFEIQGLKPAEKKKRARIHRTEVPPNRSLRMKPEQDWTAVWPARSTFKASVVPFPVRQGFVKNMDENKGVSPSAYANAELMKVPNFLHLTPAHIKAHCQGLKQFCTAWPAGLETDEKCREHFPLEVATSNYLTSGPSIRNPKARGVTCKLKLSNLELDYHGRDKLIRLAGDRYNPETQEIELHSDRCPMVKQNKDFVMYLLTALFYESQKVEVWEEEKTVADMEQYFWDVSQSRSTVINILTRIHQSERQQNEDLVTNEEELLQLEEVQNYKAATRDLMNKGEDTENLNKYKQAVLQLFNLQT